MCSRQGQSAARPHGLDISAAAIQRARDEKCSGLEVVRYTADGLHREFGQQFSRIGCASEAHVTPWGSEQEFVYCYCRLPG